MTDFTKPPMLHNLENAFNDPEWRILHSQDYRAAKVIVCLLVGVFATGLLMYSFICLVAAT